MIDRQYGNIVFECDSCGEELKTETSEFEEARAELRTEQWVVRQEGVVGPGRRAPMWCHYCPKCKNK